MPSAGYRAAPERGGRPDAGAERQYGDRPEWAADLWDAVAAELAAALRISPALASGYLRDALAMRERLPKVGQCLASGEINYTLFQVIVYRTALIPTRKPSPRWMRRWRRAHPAGRR